MSKNIDLDKFYTPIEVAKYCIEIMLEVLSDKINITEYIEPSAGGGSFSNLVDDCIAYDIDPTGPNILKEDFLKLDIPYKKGRVIFGNPPFGDRNNLARSFFKKSVHISDAIAFVLPISQLNNNDSLYEFDLIKSIDLGILEYSGIKVHCCFNVYIKPESGLNKKPNDKIDYIEIYRDDMKGYDSIDYDFAIYRRGHSSGKLRTTNLNTQTYKIKVTDTDKLEMVKNTIINFDWLNYKKHQSAPSLSKNDIYRLFKN